MSIQTVTQGKLEYLVAENISVPHCFTTRLGGVSKGPLASLNIGMHRGDEPENVAQNFRLLGNALGFCETDLVLTRQTHSDIVRRVTKSDHMGLDHHVYPECDALITNDPGTALVVFTADCTPILLHDPVTGAVGAVHAGWRGTASALAAKTVAAMAEHFGTDPKNIRAAIGPNIGFCCFETDGDVPEAIDKYLGGDSEGMYTRRADGKYMVDLKAANKRRLVQLGLKAENVDISEECTMCSHDKYWSHRYTKGLRGTQAAVIVLR